MAAEIVPIRFYNGTRAQFDLLDTASALGQPYFITDKNAIIVGDGTNAPDSGNLRFIRGSVELITSAPSGQEAAEIGLMKFDTVSDTLYISNGTGWETLSTGATSLNALTDVTITGGAVGQVLRVTSITPTAFANEVLAHADLGSVTSDQHHAQSHTLQSHTGDLAYSQIDDIVAISGSGSTTTLPRADHAHTGSDGSPNIVTSSITNFGTDVSAVSDVAANTSARHTRQHSLTSTADHTSGVTVGNLFQADANGLPADASAAIGTGGPSAAVIWHSQKVDEEIQAAIDGLDWQQSVLGRLAAPPASPTTGDRYIIIATASGAWTGEEDKIAEWNGATWDLFTPNEGWTSTVEDENLEYVYNDAYPAGSWVKRASTTQHNDLAGLQGGQSGQFQHLTTAQHTEITTFFANTDMTGAEAETLTDGSDASSLHNHGSTYYTETEIDNMNLLSEDIVDAAGDLIVGSADNTVGRLAGGSTGQVLIYDTGEGLNMRWGAVDGGTFA